VRFLPGVCKCVPAWFLQRSSLVLVIRGRGTCERSCSLRIILFVAHSSIVEDPCKRMNPGVCARAQQRVTEPQNKEGYAGSSKRGQKSRMPRENRGERDPWERSKGRDSANAS
jgi:hypothetical protein